MEKRSSIYTHIILLYLVTVLTVEVFAVNIPTNKLPQTFLSSITNGGNYISKARRKRNENFLLNEYLNDYYANYYNDYYSNYYRLTNNGYYRTTLNRKTASLDIFKENDRKYKYTPVFKYKSTQRKRKKLFVPV